MQNPSLKSDKIAKRIAFGDFTDMLCKCNEISLKQYETGATLSDGKLMSCDTNTEIMESLFEQVQEEYLT